jgi:hypothetical protein
MHINVELRRCWHEQMDAHLLKDMLHITTNTFLNFYLLIYMT